MRASAPVIAAAVLVLAGCSRPPTPTVFLCEGGDSLVVAFRPGAADLHLPPDRIVRLPQQRAASGERYTDGRYAVHRKGEEALFERGGKVRLRGCRVAGAAEVLADTATTPELATLLADSLDSVSAALTPTVRRLEPEARGWEPRSLRLWSDSARPVRLEVSEPTGPGPAVVTTDYYFVDGRLAVVRGPVNQYVFRDTALILWTTDSTQAGLDLPLRDMVARQNFVLGEVRQYLAMFGVDQ